MSFLAIPVVPYIITGSMSLYLSYKTYSNYCQNVDYVELERDNKIKNQAEREQQMEKQNENINLTPSKTASLSPSQNDNNFVSVDKEYNISIEKIPDGEKKSYSPQRPPTPYPHEKISEHKSNVEENALPRLPSPPPSPPPEIIIEESNTNSKYPQEQEKLTPHQETSPEPQEPPEPQEEDKFSALSSNKKKKRKRKRKNKK